MLHKAIVKIRLSDTPVPSPRRDGGLMRRLADRLLGRRMGQLGERFLWPVLLSDLARYLDEMKFSRIPRLTADGIESFSHSAEGRDDVRGAIEDFLAGGSDLYFESVGTVKMLAETDAGSFHHLLEIAVRRRHARDVAPIEIVVNSIDEDPATGVVQEVESFRQFVDRLELTARKHLPVGEIAVEYTGRITVDGGGSSGAENGAIIFDISGMANSGAGPPALFPLYGVTLGRTTERELTGMGRHATGKDDRGQVFKYYVISGMNFWYENGVANSIYVTNSDPLPTQWRALGFSWELSYAKWIALFAQRGFEVQEVTPPGTIPHFSGSRMTFSAEIVVIWREESGEYPIRFVFNYGEGTTAKDSDTLYSIGMRLE